MILPAMSQRASAMWAGDNRQPDGSGAARHALDSPSRFKLHQQPVHSRPRWDFKRCLQFRDTRHRTAVAMQFCDRLQACVLSGRQADGLAGFNRHGLVPVMF
jgi:hypothetical protein